MLLVQQHRPAASALESDDPRQRESVEELAQRHVPAAGAGTALGGRLPRARQGLGQRRHLLAGHRRELAVRRHGLTLSAELCVTTRTVPVNVRALSRKRGIKSNRSYGPASGGRGGGIKWALGGAAPGAKSPRYIEIGERTRDRSRLPRDSVLQDDAGKGVASFNLRDGPDGDGDSGGGGGSGGGDGVTSAALAFAGIFTPPSTPAHYRLITGSRAAGTFFNYVTPPRPALSRPSLSSTVRLARYAATTVTLITPALSYF